MPSVESGSQLDCRAKRRFALLLFGTLSHADLS